MHKPLWPQVKLNRTPCLNLSTPLLLPFPRRYALMADSTHGLDRSQPFPEDQSQGPPMSTAGLAAISTRGVLLELLLTTLGHPRHRRWRGRQHQLSGTVEARTEALVTAEKGRGHKEAPGTTPVTATTSCFDPVVKTTSFATPTRTNSAALPPAHAAGSPTQSCRLTVPRRQERFGSWRRRCLGGSC